MSPSILVITQRLSNSWLQWPFPRYLINRLRFCHYKYSNAQGHYKMSHFLGSTTISRSSARKQSTIPRCHHYGISILSQGKEILLRVSCQQWEPVQYSFKE